jgi:hypothetical protein
MVGLRLVNKVGTALGWRADVRFRSRRPSWGLATHRVAASCIEKQRCLLEGGPAEFGRLSALRPAADGWGPQASAKAHVIVSN